MVKDQGPQVTPVIRLSKPLQEIIRERCEALGIDQGAEYLRQLILTDQELKDHGPRLNKAKTNILTRELEDLKTGTL